MANTDDQIVLGLDIQKTVKELKDLGYTDEEVAQKVKILTDAQLKSIDVTQRSLDKLGKKLKEQFKEAGARLTQWLSVSSGIMTLVDQLRKMPKEVYEIDTAMTNLYKVTDETENKYTQFLDSTSDSAHDIGRSISSLVEQTANWAELGFSLDEAAQLAKISSKLATPISNGGLFITPPGSITGSARGGFAVTFSPGCLRWRLFYLLPSSNLSFSSCSRI